MLDFRLSSLFVIISISWSNYNKQEGNKWYVVPIKDKMSRTEKNISVQNGEQEKTMASVQKSW